MNNKQARAAAFTNTKTFGELQLMVDEAKKSDRDFSRLNKALPFKDCINIFESFLAPFDKEALPVTTTIDRRNKVALSPVGIAVKNIYWECG